MGSAQERLDGLENIYRLGFAGFVRTAAAITGGAESGSDAVHDAFVSCVRGLSGFREEGTLEAWIWKAVINSALRTRARARLEVPPPSVTAAERSPSGEIAEGSSSLRVAIAALPERQRLVLFLRYYADLDYRMIAETLGVSVGTVGSSLNHAHTAVRTALSQEVCQ